MPAIKNISCLLLCLCATFSLTSCSKQSEPVVNQQAPTSTPEPKMEGQSANWKVTVRSIRKVPKREHFAGEIARPTQKHDTVGVEVDIEYKGTEGDVQSPAIALIDGQGQKLEGLEASLVLNRNPSAEEALSPEYQKGMGELIGWISPHHSDYRKKPRALKTGEKFSAHYYFKDPKEYENLKFAFEDVTLIALPPPKDKKERN